MVMRWRRFALAAANCIKGESFCGLMGKVPCTERESIQAGNGRLAGNASRALIRSSPDQLGFESQ